MSPKISAATISADKIVTLSLLPAWLQVGIEPTTRGGLEPLLFH